MRGKRGYKYSKVLISGLIPAHAGKTYVYKLRPFPEKAHPRACGENVQGPSLAREGTGSSPRMRGKHFHCVSSGSIAGLIPAHAGKTKEQAGPRVARVAHPRACGENLKWGWAAVATLGSSPRMRGKLSAPTSRIESPGLIPAHAGKTHRCFLEYPEAEAHPRACGENFRCRMPMPRQRGSSPRMRGKPLPTPQQR